MTRTCGFFVFALMFFFGSGCGSHVEPNVKPASSVTEKKLGAVSIKLSETLSLLHTVGALVPDAQLGTTTLRKKVSQFPDATLHQASMQLFFERLPRRIDYFPRTMRRPMFRSSGMGTARALEIAAIESDSVDEFETRVAVILSREQRDRLIATMTAMESWHRERVWEPTLKQLEEARAQIIKRLETLKFAELIDEISAFYGVERFRRPRFTIGLLATDGSNTSNLGRAMGTFAVLEVPKGDNFDARTEVVVHEICHSIYAEQALEKQVESERWFETGSTGRVTRMLINEGLATAIGNGYVSSKLRPNDQPSSWYGDKYIDGFSKAIAPDVIAQLENRTIWDEPMTRKFIETFETTFPNWELEPTLVFSDLVFFYDKENFDSHQSWIGTRNRRIRASSPTSHKFSVIEFQKRNTVSTVFVLKTAKDIKSLSNYPFFKTVEPILREASKNQKPFSYSVKDERGGLNIFVITHDDAKSIMPALFTNEIVLDKPVYFASDEKKAPK